MSDTNYLLNNDKLAPIDAAKSPEVTQKIDWTELNASFFKYIFPSVEGHAHIIDEYLQDPRAEFYRTVSTSNIQFHDSDAEDKDWRVKRCYTILIAASSEVECGVDNLWKRGNGNGRKELPDFGRYVPRDAFKAFCSAAAYAFCNRKFWYIDKRDRPWEIFLPCLSSYNLKRRNLFKSILLMLDESMSAWRPKTSKLGGLPNISFEPRKPVPLGTMFKNGVECISGIFAFQDVVMGAENQQKKKYYGDNSIVPGVDSIPSHTAEVLRQVEGAHIPPSGWVGGDAWFGSICTAIEVYKHFDVHSTWIIKNNTHLFPMESLRSVLLARFKKPVGHWVVFKATIQGVHLFVCAYAWSMSRVSYFVSTTGNTNPSKETYRTQFEDEFGCVAFKDIPRPVFADFLYDFLPLIDEHNKQRQNILNLEKLWPTRNVWFRLITTIVGMSVVDFHRLYMNNITRDKYSLRRKLNTDNYISVRKFADMICHTLGERPCHAWDGTPKSVENIKLSSIQSHLKRVQDRSGRFNREPTNKQKGLRKEMGNPYTKNCYVCRKYLDESGGTTYITTQWCCMKCDMPLCAMDRAKYSKNNNRKMSCLHEHLMACTGDPVQCRQYYPHVFPKPLQVPFHRDGESDTDTDLSELFCVKTVTKTSTPRISVGKTLTKLKSLRPVVISKPKQKIKITKPKTSYALRKREARPTRKSIRNINTRKRKSV